MQTLGQKPALQSLSLISKNEEDNWLNKRSWELKELAKLVKHSLSLMHLTCFISEDQDISEFIDAFQNNTSVTLFCLNDDPQASAFFEIIERITPLLNSLPHQDNWRWWPNSHSIFSHCVKQTGKANKLASIMVSLYQEGGYTSFKEIFEQRDKESKIRQPFGIFKLFQSCV
jgi:hypothetical protein